MRAILARPVKPVGRRERQGVGPLRADEGPFERLVDPPRLGAEGEEALGFLRARESADGVGRGIEIGMKVEPLASRSRHGGRESTAVRASRGRRGRAGLGEKLLEHPAHGEHGRAARRCACRRRRAAASCRRALLRAPAPAPPRPARRAQGGGEAADSCPDDDDAIPRHVSPPACLLRSLHDYVNVTLQSQVTFLSDGSGEPHGYWTASRTGS